MRDHFSITYTAISNKGHVRTNNEDNLFLDGIILSPEKSSADYQISSSVKADAAVFAVCDGMGGEENGEEASLLSVRTLQKYRNSLTDPKKSLPVMINAFVDEANNALCQMITNLGKRIGTTIALIIFEKNRVTIANLGDSRVYLFHNNVLEQLSVDHTQARTLIRSGALTEEEAKTHPSRNQLTQHLGIFPAEMVIEPHILSDQEIQENDCWLICSDGLTDQVTNDEITQVFLANHTVESICKALVNKVLNREAHDNVTCIVMRAAKPRFFKSLLSWGK